MGPERLTTCLHCDETVTYRPELLNGEEHVFLCVSCFKLYDGGILTLKSLRKAQEREIRIAELSTSVEGLRKDLNGLTRAHQEVEMTLIENGM